MSLSFWSAGVKGGGEKGSFYPRFFPKKEKKEKSHFRKQAPTRGRGGGSGYYSERQHVFHGGERKEKRGILGESTRKETRLLKKNSASREGEGVVRSND